MKSNRCDSGRGRGSKNELGSPIGISCSKDEMCKRSSRRSGVFTQRYLTNNRAVLRLPEDCCRFGTVASGLDGRTREEKRYILGVLSATSGPLNVGYGI